jgi:hypothetical protein
MSIFIFYVNFLPNYAFLPIIYKNTKGIVNPLNLPERTEKFICLQRDSNRRHLYKPGRSELSVNFLPAAEVPAIQGTSRSLALPPIRKCICGIHRIQGKMGFSVWTVWSKWTFLAFHPLSKGTFWPKIY